MKPRRQSAVSIIAFALLFLQHPTLAQPPHPPTLDQILQRLEDNLNDYDTNIPSFFSDEHVVSSVFPGPRQLNTITDSVFRLKRIPQPNHTSSFEESRTVATVNGAPAIADTLTGPSVLSGVFEGALAVVSLNQKPCMDYKLDRIHPGRPYIVHFTTQPHPPQPANCLLDESTKGRVFLDPATLQITRLELTTPHHRVSRDLQGVHMLSIDYAQVPIGARTFWMPTTINSQVTADPNTFHRIVWTFKATYRSYHKLEVTSRILPSTP